MFVVITDQTLDKRIIPNNVYIIDMSFYQLKKLIQKKFDFAINLDKPYKLCDFKPAYGDIFSYYIEKFKLDFWGFCDPDIIWGKVKEQLDQYDAFSGKYDKIGTLGHLQFFKNNKKNRMLYRQVITPKSFTDYRYVFSSRFSYNFDEQFGINEIAKKEGLSILDFSNIQAPYVDVLPNEFWFKDVNQGTTEDFQYFHWDQNEGLKQCYLDKSDNVVERNISYVHFQKRAMLVCVNVANVNRFFVIPNKFITTENFKYVNFKKNKLYVSYRIYVFKHFFRKGNFSISSIRHKIEFKRMLKKFYKR